MAILIERSAWWFAWKPCERYPGGVEGFQNNCPNRSYYADESLARVGFLQPPEMEAFGDKSEAAGRRGTHEGNCLDFVIVDQIHGPIASCDWFEVEPS